MTYSEWAKREVELAFADATDEDRADPCYEYIRTCYNSALKAFLCLMEDHHTLSSIEYAKNVLYRLLAGRPLKPITEDDADWEYVYDESETGEKTFQSMRCFNLFKVVHLDGSVNYHANSYHCFDEKTGIIYYGTHAMNVLEGYLEPVTFPYYPPLHEFELHTNEYLSDRKNGDFDTIEYLYLLTPQKCRVEIGRYFAEMDDGWREIDKKTFDERVRMHEEREKREKEDADED